MAETVPWFWIIGGPNGAGKTTLSKRFLPAVGGFGLPFLNADEIARGLAPLDPAGASMQAGRLLLDAMAGHVTVRQSFAVETTLSSTRYARTAATLRADGWRVGLLYVWIPSAATSAARVRQRVEFGGHDIPQEAIDRRYPRSIANLRTYIAVADRWLIFDNSGRGERLMAAGGPDGPQFGADELARLLNEADR